MSHRPKRSFILLQLRRHFGGAEAALVPVAHPDASSLLERAGLRDPSALRSGDGRRHLPSGNGVARARAAAVEGRLCPALAPPDRRPLWRESQSAPALLPISGDPEAEPARSAVALPRQ